MKFDFGEVQGLQNHYESSICARLFASNSRREAITSTANRNNIEEAA